MFVDDEAARRLRRVRAIQADIVSWQREADETDDRAKAAELESAKIDVCRTRLQQRLEAQSPYAAAAYEKRSLRYATRSYLFNGFMVEDESRAQEIVDLEDEIDRRLAAEHPVTFYWRDHFMQCTSERRQGEGTRYGHLLEASVVISSGSPPNERWHATVISRTFSPPSFPWVESPVDFYSVMDGKAWCEQVMKGEL